MLKIEQFAKEVMGIPLTEHQIQYFEYIAHGNMVVSTSSYGRVTLKKVIEGWLQEGLKPVVGIPERHEDTVKLLQQLIDIVNPKEKLAESRIRQLRARLKEYTAEDIIGAAYQLSLSEWHQENHQMSIDNLLAPSKFGRWFAKYQEQQSVVSTAENMKVEYEQQEQANRKFRES